MERLQIGEVIFNLRKEKGITQEQLANFIGVSTAAVSKWEIGASYPDITLLPKLATFFSITIDKLLNYNVELSVSEVMKVYSECEKAFSSRRLDDAVQLCESYLSKYPGSYLLKFRIGYLFFIYAWKALEEEEIKKLMAYSIQLLEDVANNCNDDELVEASLFQLGALYSNLGDNDKAIEVLNKIKMGEAYLRHGKIEKALNAFKTMLEHIKNNDINEVGDFEEVWCFNELKAGQQKLSMNLYENLFKLLQQPVFDSVKDKEEFESIIEELRCLEEKSLSSRR